MESTPEFEDHVSEVRTVNDLYDPPLIDFWTAETIDALTDLTVRKGRITGTIGKYRVQYYAGTDLPVEFNLWEAETGRQIAQDGSDDLTLLERLRARVASAT